MAIASIEPTLHKALKSGDTLSPFLFLGNNLESIHAYLDSFTATLLDHYKIPTATSIKIPDAQETIKIQQVRELLRAAHMKPHYRFQLFIIENISRLTLSASNSLLKFLEEPGKYNIIFLTNASETGVLDTILSRVQVVQTGLNITQSSSDFFSDMLTHINTPQGKTNLLSYTYSAKHEKQEYTQFLQTLLHSSAILSANKKQELSDDIMAIANNNVLPKYILDKWVLQITNP